MPLNKVSKKKTQKERKRIVASLESFRDKNPAVWDKFEELMRSGENSIKGQFDLTTMDLNEGYVYTVWRKFQKYHHWVKTVPNSGSMGSTANPLSSGTESNPATATAAKRSNGRSTKKAGRNQQEQTAGPSTSLSADIISDGSEIRRVSRSSPDVEVDFETSKQKRSESTVKKHEAPSDIFPSDFTSATLRKPVLAMDSNPELQYGLLLKYRDTECFMNVVINMLFACDSIRIPIGESSSTSTSSVVKHLKDLFLRKTATVDAIRRVLPSEFTEDEHDPGVGFMALCAAIEDQGETRYFEELSFMQERKTVCERHRNHVTVQNEQHFYSHIAMAQKSCWEEQQFEWLYKESWRPARVACVFDGCDSFAKQTRKVLRDELIGEYHVLLVHDGHIHFARFRANEPVEMHGFQWNLVAFTSHVYEGRYHAFMKMSQEDPDSTWARIDNHFPPRIIRKSDLLLDNFTLSILVFRKIVT